MSTAEPAGKQQKRAAGGIVEEIGREILVQAREMDRASSSGTKFGVAIPRYWPEYRMGPAQYQYISIVKQTAGAPFYVVDVIVPTGKRRVTRAKATFKNMSNAILSFIMANGETVYRSEILYAFPGKDSPDQLRVPVARLTFGLPTSDTETGKQERARVEQLKAAQLIRLKEILEDSVTVTAA